MLTAIIVDDEYYAAEGLKFKLEKLEQVKVLGTYYESKTALEEFVAYKPDIAFLDIELPEMQGLELANIIMEENPSIQIVFVTAYSEYAVEAFELDASDYLVKPVKMNRLKKTIDRLQQRVKDFDTAPAREIHIGCFGNFSINIDGKEVDIAWRTKKVRELLVYLACSEGKFVSKEKVSEDLWPEMDPKKSKSNFNITLHHLKKQSEQSGLPILVETIRGRIRLNTDMVTLDLIEFQRAFNSLEEITTDNVLLAEKAVKMYKGMLLEDLYYPWATELQQEYDIQYVELLNKLAEYYRLNNNQEKYRYYLNKMDG